MVENFEHTLFSIASFLTTAFYFLLFTTHNTKYCSKKQWNSNYFRITNLDL